MSRRVLFFRCVLGVLVMLAACATGVAPHDEVLSVDGLEAARKRPPAEVSL